METKLSTHKVEVVPVVLEKHPNADSLSIVKVWDYTVVVRTEDWPSGKLGAYIPPDSVVPDTPEFSFLGGHRRIRVRKFRGVISQGLLMSAPEGAKLGEDVAEQLGVTHYEPPWECSTGGETGPPPPGVFLPGKYDVESFFKYATLFQEGEEIVATEKIHGASARYVFSDGQLYVGSRIEWKRESETSIWWQALKTCPWIEEFCREHPGQVLFGEVYGPVQSFRYGCVHPHFRVFDIWDRARWLPWDDSQVGEISLHWVPVVYTGPFNKEKLIELSNGSSLMPGAGHCREGIVVRTRVERMDLEIGRMQLKIVSDEYLEKH